MELFSKISLAFEHGGLWMWPIAAYQVISIAILIERSIALYKTRRAGELEFVATELAQGWAQELAGLLVEMKAAVERSVEAGADHLDPGLLGRYLSRYDAIVTTASPRTHQPPAQARPGGRRDRRLRTSPIVSTPNATT